MSGRDAMSTYAAGGSIPASNSATRSNRLVPGSSSRTITSAFATPIRKLTSVPQVEAPPCVIVRAISSIEAPSGTRNEPAFNPGRSA